jgi:hypothetical protein
MTTRSSQVASAPATAATTAVATSSKRASKGKKEKEFAEEWVQCDLCARWRLLPPPNDLLYPKELPDKWVCTMNTWNPAQALCSIAEETTTGPEVNTQRAAKLRCSLPSLLSSSLPHSVSQGVGSSIEVC